MSFRTFIISITTTLLLVSCAVQRTGSQKTIEEPGKTARKQDQTAPRGKFVQEGIAGWYGQAGSGTMTKNGKQDAREALTAAHKTLPLDVFVKVRNKQNGKETVVRLTGRGPLVKGRIIDLSPAAAKKLGIKENNGAPVRIEALGTRIPNAAGQDTYEQVESYDEGSFSVQVKVFANRNRAERLANELKKVFGHAEVRSTKGGGEQFYRVYVGMYSSLREAEAAERKFSEHGYPGSFTLSWD